MQVRAALYGAILASAAQCVAQNITPTIPSTVTASASAVPTSVQAGEPANIVITLGSPAPRDLTVNGGNLCGQSFKSFSGNIKKGETKVNVSVQTQSSDMSADCLFDSITIPPSQESSAFKDKIVDPSVIPLSPAAKFHIEGIPHVSETLPTTASAVVEPSDRQFFRTRATGIRSLRDDLAGFLDKHSTDSENLRDELVLTLQNAQKQLTLDRNDYDIRYLKSGQDRPAFFLDLERRYSALIRDIQFSETPKRTASAYAEPHLLLVQELKTRPERDFSQERYGTYPPDALSTMQLLDWHINVYMRIAATGEHEFLLSLSSKPEGATVFSKKIGDHDYTPLGKQTNIPEIKFDFAVYTFKFVKAGCKDLTRPYDPINDTSPVLEVELSCK